jgi:aromatic-L-amino-acid decarboxylase
LNEVDSLSLDPHKWLFQPFEAGCTLVRNGALLEKHFQVFPEYLKDVAAAGEEVNFCDRGMQLTRSFRALKLWMTIQIFGLENLRRAVEHGIEMAEYAETLLRARDDCEVMTKAQLGIVSFRFRAPRGLDIDAFNRRLATSVIEDGYTLVSSTELDGRTVLRICPINPRTTKEDMASAVTRIGEIARRI